VDRTTVGTWLRLYETGGLASWGTCAFSRDGGWTWSGSRKGLDRSCGWVVVADGVRPEVWYISAAPGAFKAHSHNNAQAHIFRNEGAGWRQLAGGLPQPLNAMPYALLTERGAPGLIYAGLSNGDIWQSADYGEQWTQLPVSLGRIERTLVML
jgi:hypothetical protein